MRPGDTPRPHRLYLFEPYSPDRIPIIMVHGLRSTPLIWQQLIRMTISSDGKGVEFLIALILVP